MAKKKLFDDLKQAIENVIKYAYELEIQGQKQYVISEKELYILQSEYNIHFVEPHEKQLDCITK